MGLTSRPGQETEAPPNAAREVISAVLVEAWAKGSVETLWKTCGWYACFLDFVAGKAGFGNSKKKQKPVQV